jgi:hypothetical protein
MFAFHISFLCTVQTSHSFELYCENQNGFSHILFPYDFYHYWIYEVLLYKFWSKVTKSICINVEIVFYNKRESHYSVTTSVVTSLFKSQ